MSDPSRTRKPSDEGIQVPVKPIPRARRIMSPPSAPPPPPPDTGEHPPECTPDNGDGDNEELNIDDIHLTDNDKDDNDVDGRESVTSDTVAVDTVAGDTVAKDTVTNSNTTSPVDEQRKESVSTPDCIIDNSDSDDDGEHDYMNWSEVKMRSNDSEEPHGKRRPLSNYCNVAPLPEPGAENKDTPTTKTTGVPTPNSITNDDPDEGSPSTYRFKPKHRAPARPPPGYKKLPPVDNNLKGGTKGTGGEEGVTLDPKTSPIISRNRPVVKKTNSIPLPPSPTPRQNIPAKPPRNRNKSDVHILGHSPSSSPTPPPLVHPVVIPPRPKNELKSGKSSPALEEQSNDETKITKLSTDTTVSPLPTHKSTPSLAAPRKAPLPPPGKTPDNKTPPTYRKGSLNNEQSSKSSSPGGGRKAARVAPPPPKPSKSGNDNDESIKPTAKPVKTDTSDELGCVVKPPTVPPKHVKPLTESAKEMDKENCEVPLSTASESKNLKAMKETINNVQSMIENPACETSGASSVKTQGEEQIEEDEIVLSRMNLFTVEMRKVDGQGFGLHIAEGYAQTSKGLEVKGVFVKEIVAGSPADNCGRVRESDMIIDIAGCSMVGASLEDAARILKQSGNIVRLKIGRTFSGAEGGRSVVADIQLSPLQEENEQLKTELASLKVELEESKESNVDLTQAIANVTVEKTKLDIQTKSLKDKLEKAKAAALAATEKQSEGSDEKVDELQKKVEQLGTTNASLEDKLDTALKDIVRLEGELETSKSELDAKKKVTSSLEGEIESLKKELADHKCKEEELNKKVTDSAEEIKQLKEALDKDRKEKDLLTKSLSEKIISLEEELANSKEMVVVEVQDTKPKPEEPKLKEPKSEEPKDAPTITDDSEKTAPEESIDKKSPKKPKKQLQVQSTANDDPSEPKETSSSKEPAKVKATPPPEVKVSSPSKRPKSMESTSSRSSRDVTPLTDDEFDTFEEIKSMNRLDSSTALQKTQLTAQMRRKKPSRSHVQSLANLSPFPEEMTPLKAFDDENRKSLNETQLPSVAPRPKPKPEAAAPKPKPRPQPRKKQSPDHLTSPVTETPPKTTPESPVPAKRPIPVPRTPSKESNVDNNEPKEPDHVTSSPKRSPLLPPKPKASDSPEHSPAVKPKPRPISDTKNESDVTVGESVSTEQHQPPTPAKKPKPPKATPGGDSIDAKIEALKQKDPSELTVKEKMMLAQQAMVKQAEYKAKGMPPPVRKRPPLSAKAESLDIDVEDSPVRKGVEDEVDANMERSQSVDDLLDESPKRQPRKLPPGAFKLGIPMGLPTDNRMRSYTVGSTSTEPSRSSLEESLEVKRESRSSEDQKTNDDETLEKEEQEEEMAKEEEVVPVENKIVESEDPSDITTMSTPDVSGHDMNSMNSMEDLAVDDTLETNEALLETQTSRSGTMQADAEQVLYWTPEVVGIWLDSINLGQYAQVIKEKDIKGYMLFDIDTGRLKVLGFNNDDRKTFAKEVKILKPFAEKLKKEHERQKKEEKKRLEQEKKLAKKKKK